MGLELPGHGVQQARVCSPQSHKKWNVFISKIEMVEKPVQVCDRKKIKLPVFTKATRAVPTVMPPLLLCWTMKSVVDVGGLAVEVEPSCQYSITFCYHVTDDSRGVVSHNGIWHGSTSEAKVCHCIPPCRKMAPIDIHWHLVNVSGDQTVSMSTLRRWVVHFSSGDSDMKERHILDGHAYLSHHEMKSISISSSRSIGRLWSGNCVWSWISTLMCRKQWWQCWNTAKFEPGESHKYSDRNRNNTVCKFFRTHWTNTPPKVTVAWIASSLVTGHSANSSQNSILRIGDMQIPHQRKRSRCSPQQAKWCTLSGIGNGWSFWISWNTDTPSTLPPTLWRWLSWRPEFPKSGQRKRSLSCNTVKTITPVGRLCSTLPVVPRLSYHAHSTVQIWYLLNSICLLWWKMDCMGNIFLATTPSQQLWNSGSPPLVEVFMNTT